MWHWWNDSARGKPLPLPLCSQQITFELGRRNLLFLPTLVEALRYKQKVAGSIPDGVIGIFH
jgi:hypothetical protein